MLRSAKRSAPSILASVFELLAKALALAAPLQIRLAVSTAVSTIKTHGRVRIAISGPNAAPITIPSAAVGMAARTANRAPITIPSAATLSKFEFCTGFNTQMAHTLTEAIEAFHGACRDGQLEAVQRLVSDFDITLADIGECAALVDDACSRGHLRLVQWLVSHYKLDADDIFINCENPLAHACLKQHEDLADWLMRQFASEMPTACAEHAMCCAIAGGSDSLPMRVAYCFGFDVDGTSRRFAAKLFQVACANGRLAIAQWLAVNLQIKTSLTREPVVVALRWACRHGHLGVAQWLVAEFEMTADDRALIYATLNAHHAVVHWLTGLAAQPLVAVAVPATTIAAAVPAAAVTDAASPTAAVTDADAALPADESPIADAALPSRERPCTIS